MIARASEPDEAADHPVGQLLRRAYYRAKSNTGSELKALNITPTQASVVLALARYGPLSQAEIGRAIAMDPPNVHALVDRLRKLGYVELRANPSDQREVRVALSAAGKKRAADVTTRTQRSGDRTLAALTHSEQTTFLRLLKRIALDPLPNDGR